MSKIEEYGCGIFSNLAYCLAVLLVIQCCLGRGYYY